MVWSIKRVMALVVLGGLSACASGPGPEDEAAARRFVTQAQELVGAPLYLKRFDPAPVCPSPDSLGFGPPCVAAPPARLEITAVGLTLAKNPYFAVRFAGGISGFMDGPSTAALLQVQNPAQAFQAALAQELCTHGGITFGMSEAEVRQSPWGPPPEVRREVMAGNPNTLDVWRYPSGSMVWFLNDKVARIKYVTHPASP